MKKNVKLKYCSSLVHIMCETRVYIRMLIKIYEIIVEHKDYNHVQISFLEKSVGSFNLDIMI